MTHIKKRAVSYVARRFCSLIGRRQKKYICPLLFQPSRNAELSCTQLLFVCVISFGAWQRHLWLARGNVSNLAIPLPLPAAARSLRLRWSLANCESWQTRMLLRRRQECFYARILRCANVCIWYDIFLFLSHIIVFILFLSLFVSCHLLTSSKVHNRQWERIKRK